MIFCVLLIKTGISLNSSSGRDEQLLTTADRRGDVVQKGIKLHTANQLQAVLTLGAFGS